MEIMNCFHRGREENKSVKKQISQKLWDQEVKIRQRAPHSRFECHILKTASSRSHEVHAKRGVKNL